MDTNGFPIQKCEFLCKVKEIKELREGILAHAAQTILPIDPREICPPCGILQRSPACKGGNSIGLTFHRTGAEIA